MRFHKNMALLALEQSAGMAALYAAYFVGLYFPRWLNIALAVLMGACALYRLFDLLGERTGRRLISLSRNLFAGGGPFGRRIFLPRRKQLFRQLSDPALLSWRDLAQRSAPFCRLGERKGIYRAERSIFARRFVRARLGGVLLL